MTFSPTALARLLPVNAPTRRFWVALSGGLDSVVLLHSLAALKLPIPLTALHINHQISPNADSWQEHCASLCRELQIPFVAEAVQVERAGRGLEDAARIARYAVFERHLGAGDVLLAAHHADDQVETLLLRLLRGAGPRGLAAMAQMRPLGLGNLFRPLMAFSRAELEAYANAHQLRWVEDESNLDTHYDRNFLRSNVIPPLQERWPQFRRRFQQSAELCADSEALLVELAEEDLIRSDARPERLGQSMSLALMGSMSLARRHNLLRHWLRGQGFDVPEQVHLQQFEQQIMVGRADAEIALSWGNLILHRYRERLYAVPNSLQEKMDDKQVREAGQPFLLAGQSCQVKWRSGYLTFEYCDQVNVAGYLKAGLSGLTLRSRHGGERCQPLGRAHSQTVKRLLQEYALEPWWRDQLPLVFWGDQIVAAGDLWVCTDFAADLGQPGYRLLWQSTNF